VPGTGSQRRVHLVDGTYELFRHFFGAPPRASSEGGEVGAVRGVVQSVLSMLGGGATHVGVATDHVIESFRNDLWPGYKTGEGVDPLLKAQFPLLEAALGALGVTVWPMVELEADDALASAAAVADDDRRVGQVLVCTPDKDLAQCVRGQRVVQLDRRKDVISDEDAVRARYGIGPTSIPDWLALVGDSADGFPGLAGWGKQSASTVLGHYPHLEDIPASLSDWDPALRSSLRTAAKLADRLASDMDAALLFRDLATLRVDRALLASVDDLEWKGPTAAFDDIARFLRDPALADRAGMLASRR
jgi:5'-3' exonuclease